MKTVTQKRAIIVGATSGIGYETARLLLKEGWALGIAGRRAGRLKAFQREAPSRVCYRVIDIRKEGAETELEALIADLGGMDLYLHCSGIGHQNFNLTLDTETDTAATNVTGFIRMTGTAFHYFARQGRGHIAIVSSIAGTQGLGIAPAYSATKRFQNTYLDALEQLARMHGQKNIRFTDIRPGFVKTDLLNDGKRYPLLMHPEKVARHIVRALHHKKRVAVIDWRYRLLVEGWRLIPRWIWKRLPIRN